MEFVYTKRFVKELAKFSKPIKDKVRERIAIFSVNENNTILNNHKLNPPWGGYKSMNVTGNIRIVYKKDTKSCTLYRIGTHSQLYS